VPSKNTRSGYGIERFMPQGASGYKHKDGLPGKAKRNPFWKGGSHAAGRLMVFVVWDKTTVNTFHNSLARRRDFL
jgi:hypothetical protein